LMSVLSAIPSDRHVFLPIESLKSDLANTITHTYQRLAIPLDRNFVKELRLEDANARFYVSKHVYSLEQFGLDEETLRKRFSRVYEKYELSIRGNRNGENDFLVQKERIHDGTSPNIGHATHI